METALRTPLNPESPAANPARPGTRLRWWHQMIGRDDKFFDLLNAAAVEARTSVGLLSTYLANRRTDGVVQPGSADLSESRRRQKRIRTDTIEELYKTLVPPFDREDIQALAYAL